MIDKREPTASERARNRENSSAEAQRQEWACWVPKMARRKSRWGVI